MFWCKQYSGSPANISMKSNPFAESTSPKPQGSTSQKAEPSWFGYLVQSLIHLHIIHKRCKLNENCFLVTSRFWKHSFFPIVLDIDDFLSPSDRWPPQIDFLCIQKTGHQAGQNKGQVGILHSDKGVFILQKGQCHNNNPKKLFTCQLCLIS